MSDLSKLKKFLDDGYRSSYLDSHVKGSVAYQIQALREDLGLNQTQFGALVGMSQAVISRLENADNRGVNINTLLKIALKLKIALRIQFCNFEDMLTDDVSPGALRVENVQQTISRVEAPVGVQSASIGHPAITSISITGSSQAWQIHQVPNQPSLEIYGGLGTLNSERYTSMAVLSDYHLTT